MSVIQPLPKELCTPGILEIITGYAHSPEKVQALWGAQNTQFAAAARANWRSDYVEVTERLPETHFVHFLITLRPDIERSLLEMPTHERQILVAQKVKTMALEYIHGLIRIVREERPDFRVPIDLNDCSYTQMGLFYQELRDYLLVAAFRKIFESTPQIITSVGLPEDGSDTQKAAHIRTWLDSARNQPEVQNLIDHTNIWIHRLAPNFPPELLRFANVPREIILTHSIMHRQWHTVCAALQSSHFDHTNLFFRFKSALEAEDQFTLHALLQYVNVDDSTRRAQFLYAARASRVDIVREMLEYWKISEEDLSNVLREWIDKNASARLIKIVLQKHIFNPRTLGSLIVIASYRHNRDAIKAILESGQTINPESLGELLSDAVEKRDSEVYELILHSNRDIDLASLGKALARAARNRDLKAVEMILNGGGELFALRIDSKGLGWALDVAADKGDVKIVQAILNSNRRIDSESLASAMRTAMEKRHGDITRLILRSGRKISTDILMKIDVTAAAERDFPLFVEFLQKGPRLSPEDLGEILVNTAYRQNSRAVQAILSCGQPISESALLRAKTLAKKLGNQEIIAILDGPPDEGFFTTLINTMMHG